MSGFCFTLLVLASALTLLPVQSARAAIPGMESLTDLIEERLDANEDGKINQTEWDTGAVDGFNEIDTDGDGILTVTELEGITTPLAKELGDFAASFVSILIRQVILSFDSDESGTVSLAEFDKQSGKLREKIDADKDGIITRSELNELPSKLLPE